MDWETGGTAPGGLPAAFCSFRARLFPVQTAPPWHPDTTAILAMLPPAAVVILMQKWFVKGLVDTEK